MSSLPSDVSISAAARQLGLTRRAVLALVARYELDIRTGITAESLASFDPEAAAQRLRKREPGPWRLCDATAEHYLGRRP